MMSVIVRDGSGETCYVKGAPERVIKKCKYILINGEIEDLTDKHRYAVEKAIEKMSYEALRCIAGLIKEKGLQEVHLWKMI